MDIISIWNNYRKMCYTLCKYFDQYVTIIFIITNYIIQVKNSN